MRRVVVDLNKETEKIREYVIWLREQFHRHPELGMEEYVTSAMIQRTLKEMRIPFQKIGETGVMGQIGQGSDRCIGLRADMDALRIQEENEISYRSEIPGMMHACGHDAHMAALLGAARILKKYERNLKGTIRLLFQPSEENCKGAKMMVEKGCLVGMDEIFGLHVFGDIPYGSISLEPGARMAITDRFTIRLTGRPGHAGKPHQCVDAALAGASLLLNLQAIVGREIDPIDPAVVTVGSLQAGTQYNIIAQEAVLEGTVRTFREETSRQAEAAVRRMAEATAAVYRATAQVIYHPSEHPVVYNDPEVTERARQGAIRYLGEERLVQIPQMMLGEDFSVYQSIIPGAFAFVGAGGDGLYPNHHARFQVEKEALLDSVKLYAAYALETL